VTVETELTPQKSRAIGAINGVKYQDSDLGEDPAEAVDAAVRMLEDGRGTGSPIEIILLYGDGCDASVAGCPSASKRAASQADSRGMAVMLMCYKDSTRQTCATSYRQMASQNNFYFENEGQIPNRVKELADKGKQLSVGSLAFLEKLAPGFSFVAGSGVPVPQVNGQDLTFNFKDLLPGQVITAKYRVQPKAEGKQPLRGASAINLTDSLNRAADALPVPPHEVTIGPCVVETPTPTTTPTTAATATRTPSATPRASDTPAATHTPADTPVPTLTRTPTPAPSATATATPESVAVYLPITVRQVCKPGEVHTDVILIIDASSSMREPSGTTTKLDAARKAALDFVDNLQLGQDQAAVVSFNAQARLDLPLSRDRAALERAINGISTAAGTRIDLALERAGQELASGRPIAGNNRAVILLTDGRTDAGTSDRALAAAASLKSGKAAIYTIGLGADVDAVFLRQIASSPLMYLEAPTADQLAGIYEEIAGSLPCPGGVFWGE
jgi:Mg-chelatase subunit ChlD